MAEGVVEFHHLPFVLDGVSLVQGECSTFHIEICCSKFWGGFWIPNSFWCYSVSRLARQMVVFIIRTLDKGRFHWHLAIAQFLSSNLHFNVTNVNFHTRVINLGWWLLICKIQHWNTDLLTFTVAIRLCVQSYGRKKTAIAIRNFCFL